MQMQLVAVSLLLMLLSTSESRSRGSQRGSLPSSPQRPSSPPRTPNPTRNSAPYGWRAPSSQTTRPTPRPHTPQKTLDTGQRNNPTGWQKTPNPTPGYGWQRPQKNTIPTSKPPISQKRQDPYPKQTPQPNQYNTGKKYEKGYSKGYDEGYQRGLQQQNNHALRVHPNYYPPQSHFGYPGQGINVGYGSPTYQGMSMFGSPNSYGYPVSNAYGYNTYGTGSNYKQGLLLGAVSGYALHSLLHPSRSLFSSSNSWGYSGAGYGSNYHYNRAEPTVINNYFTTPGIAQEAGDKSGPENWVQCVAYDPMADATYTNPNCSCTVTTEIDPETNITVASHNCKTIWGRRVVEKTPISDVEVFDPKAATIKESNPEKLREIDIAMNRTEAYEKLQKILNMGCFTCEK